jgi:hypothetical protein
MAENIYGRHWKSVPEKLAQLQKEGFLDVLSSYMVTPEIMGPAQELHHFVLYTGKSPWHKPGKFKLRLDSEQDHDTLNNIIEALFPEIQEYAFSPISFQPILAKSPVANQEDSGSFHRGKVQPAALEFQDTVGHFKNTYKLDVVEQDFLKSFLSGYLKVPPSATIPIHLFTIVHLSPNVKQLESAFLGLNRRRPPGLYNINQIKLDSLLG